MPIFDQGYQHWDGNLSGHTWRWWTIARRGIRAKMKSRWTSFMFLITLVPALALATALVLWGLLEQKSSILGPLAGVLELLPADVKATPESYRVPVWTIAYQFFFGIVLFFAMILVVFIGPGLVSQDLRFNAMPLYFSRPLRRFDYFAGKLGVIAAYLGIVTIIPPILAWLLGIAFSLDLAVIKDTAGVMFAGVLFGCVFVVSAGALMLAMSSLTRRSLYVGVLWVGMWLVTLMVGGILVNTIREPRFAVLSYEANLDRTAAELLDTRSAWERFGRFLVPEGMVELPYHDSPRHRRSIPPVAQRMSAEEIAKRREERVAEASETRFPWIYSGAVLTALFGLSLWILSTRVKSMDRLK